MSNLAWGELYYAICLIAFIIAYQELLSARDSYGTTTNHVSDAFYSPKPQLYKTKSVYAGFTQDSTYNFSPFQK